MCRRGRSAPYAAGPMIALKSEQNQQPGSVDQRSIAANLCGADGCAGEVAAVQAGPLAHWRILTPAPVEIYQSSGLNGIDGDGPAFACRELRPSCGR